MPTFQVLALRPTRAHQPRGFEAALRHVLLAVAVVGCSAAAPRGASLPYLHDAAVATDHPESSRVAAEILQAGGTAADAAAAAALVLGVVNPTSSGLGGGGFALVYDANRQQTMAYDFREVAPAKLTTASFVVAGQLKPSAATAGGLASGVPGEVAGLYRLVQAHGRTPWQAVVAPAAALARQGFVVSPFLAKAIAAVFDRLPDEARFAPLRAMLSHDGQPAHAGQTLKRASLGQTLERLGQEGPAAFYQGPIAEHMVATVGADRGVLSLADLAAYQVLPRTPLTGTWKGYRLATMPLPSSGGMVLINTLHMLDALPTDISALAPDDATRMHLLAEAMKHGFADRARWLGDTDRARRRLTELMQPARVKALAARISPTQAQPPEAYGSVRLNVDDHGTSHLCVIDSYGNAVALTTTVNGYFGSKLVTPDGIVMNNQMDDFALDTVTPNMYGLTQSVDNLVTPGHRPLSSMTPTLIFDGQGVIGCAGGSGGPYIISGTLQALLNAFGGNMTAQAALAAPRLHHQWSPNQLVIELPPEAPARDVLIARGHTLVDRAGEAVVQLVRVFRDGHAEAAADPRKGGVGVVVPRPRAQRGP